MLRCQEVLQRERRSLRVLAWKKRYWGRKLTSCPKCVSHFECLKSAGDEAYADIESSTLCPSSLAVNEQKSQLGAETTVGETAEA